MPGQPNRKSGVSGVPVRDPVTGRVAGVGNHSIDRDWSPTDDSEELKKRLERKSRQVEKLKADRGELRAAIKLKTEEAYNEGLLSVAPKLLEIDKRVAEITQTILSGSIDEDALKLLKALLPELSKQRDRLYGKTRQRVDTTSSSFSADLTELMNRKSVVSLPALPDPASDVVDAEVVDEEMIDE